jgi:hypothetical protein
LPQAYHFNIGASGHHIHLDQPAAVDEAVELVSDRLICQPAGTLPASSSRPVGRC